MAETDAQLQMTKRARRRLIGATAFVALAAIVLPMVMDSEPPMPGGSLQIRIPDPSHTPPLATPMPETRVAISSANKAEVVNKPEAVATVVTQPVSTEKAADKSASKSADSPAKAAETKALPDKAPPEKSAASAKSQTESRVAALLSGKTEHIVLIGAYADETNVKRIRSKLAEMRVPTYTEAYASPRGHRTRVRAGPFTTRSEAEQALSRMKRVGVDGVLSTR